MTAYFSTMTERAFTLSLHALSDADRSHALGLFCRWRFAYRRTKDGRPPQCAIVWKKVAESTSQDLAAFLKGMPLTMIPPAHMAEIDALRALAIEAAHRGTMQ